MVNTSKPLSMVSRHIGVFFLIFAVTWMLVHFIPAPPELLYAVPALYFLYLGTALVVSSVKRRGGSGTER